VKSISLPNGFAQAPLLIIATTRPEFRPPWKLRSHHGVISLAPLDASEIARMIGEIATRHALSKGSKRVSQISLSCRLRKSSGAGKHGTP
jgi:predicted ATPase